MYSISFIFYFIGRDDMSGACGDCPGQLGAVANYQAQLRAQSQAQVLAPRCQPLPPAVDHWGIWAAEEEQDQDQPAAD